MERLKAVRGEAVLGWALAGIAAAACGSCASCLFHPVALVTVRNSGREALCDVAVVDPRGMAGYGRVDPGREYTRVLLAGEDVPRTLQFRCCGELCATLERRPIDWPIYAFSWDLVLVRSDHTLERE